MGITRFHNRCLAEPDTYNQDLEGAQQVSTLRPPQNPCCLLRNVQSSLQVGWPAPPPPCFPWRSDAGSYRDYDFMTFLSSNNTTRTTSSAPTPPTHTHTHLLCAVMVGRAGPLNAAVALANNANPTLPRIGEETGDLSPPSGDTGSIVAILPSCHTTYHKCEGAA